MMPSFPAFVVMISSLVFLFPGRWPGSMLVPIPRSRLSRRTRLALLGAAGVAFALYPLALVAAASPLRGPRPQAYVVNGLLRSVDPVADLTATVSGGRAPVALESRRAVRDVAVSYRIWRSGAANGGASCTPVADAVDDCQLAMDDLGAQTGGAWIDRPGTGTWTYRLALAANWLDDPAFGDVYLGRTTRSPSACPDVSTPAPTYSIVVPIYNEQDCIDEMLRRLSAVLAALDVDYEIIFVDDGSRDSDLDRLRCAGSSSSIYLVRAQLRTPVRVGGRHRSRRWRRRDLARRRPPAPTRAHSRSSRAVAGRYDVVYGVMTARPAWLKRATARAYYRLLRRLASVEIPAAAGDFRLADRRVIEAFRAMPERNRFVRGMFAWLGFRQLAVRTGSLRGSPAARSTPCGR